MMLRVPPYQIFDLPKAQVGLGEADNTSDLNKPISLATANAITAINLSISNLSNSVSAVSNATVGVGSPTSLLNRSSGDGRYVLQSGGTLTGRLVLNNAFTGNLAPLNIPNVGTTDPSSLSNGDIWQRSNDLYFRRNGATSLIWNDANLSVPSQVEAETGTDTTARVFTAQRVRQAADAAILAQKAQNNGLASLDSGGKIPTSQLPALSITDVFEVSSQSAMLALSAQQGDVAIRTDLNKSFVLSSNSPTTLADWRELRTPTDVVLSVAGETGAITAAALKAALSIQISDVSGLQTAINGRQPLNSTLTSLAGQTWSSGKIVFTLTAANTITGFPIGASSGTDILDRDAGDARYLASSSYTASDVRTKLLTVDGAGSGIDADLLDGIDSTSFMRRDVATATFGNAISNANVIMTFNHSGTGFRKGFNLSGATDGAGLYTIEYATDSTLYEMWMSDNPDGPADIFSWRYQDWQGLGGTYQPLRISNLSARFIGTSTNFFSPITQNTANFYTTGDPDGVATNSQFNNFIDTPSKLKVSGTGTVTITNLNVSGYTGTSGSVIWIKLTSPTLFNWGIGDVVGGTPVQTGLSVSTTGTTLNNGIIVTFSSISTGLSGDSFQFRAWRTSANTFGATNFLDRVVFATSFPNNTAPLSIPNVGTTDPTTLVNGDVWHRSNGLYLRINGVTQQFWHTGNLLTNSQSEAEAGTATTARVWSAERVRQAANAAITANSLVRTVNGIAPDGSGNLVFSVGGGAGTNDGSIWGLLASNTLSFTTTRVTLSIGSCKDSTNEHNLVLSAPLTKRLDAVWAAGDNNGGRDQVTGPAANETWHLHLIYNTSTLAVDGLWSKSPTNPILPSGFTKFRRVFSITTETGSGNIRQFVHYGEYTELKVRGTEVVSASDGVATGILRTLVTPLGIKVLARLYYSQTSGNIGACPNPCFVGVFDPDVGVPTFGVSTQWAQFRVNWDSSDTNSRYVTDVLTCWTNTNQQVFSASTDTNGLLVLGTIGWFDYRGRFY